MTFTEDDLIFPSKKICENIKNINDTISILYKQSPGLNIRNTKNKFNKVLDEIENSINTIKKVKIKQIESFSFISKFPAIYQFILEGNVLENIEINPLQKRFLDLAKELSILLDIYPKYN